MAPEKRNQFLDPDESDDDGSQGYDSEAEQVQKGGRTAKRRKLGDNVASDEDDALSADEYNDESDEPTVTSQPKTETLTPKNLPDKADGEKSKSRNRAELPDVSRPLTKKNLVASQKAVKKSGVIYISRVPPGMKTAKLRNLLEPLGTINRIWCAPEDPQIRSRRIKSGGNKKKNFTEGWIEFVNKKEAKAAVELLNGNLIGGKKGSYFRDDVWSLIYLKGFKWNNLTEQIASETAERASRMRAEISKEQRNTKEFVRNIEQGKMLEGIESKAAAKKGSGDGNPDKASSLAERSGQPKSKLKFTQSAVGNKGTDKAPEEAQRVFRQLF
ncbi:Uu.00g052430.m01.CDS01 [Anthostomella pinea]|uniref:18S rRNA factor 2 n=1 Tax=Anthostomella pinea TaxID=933095 RepID=A0AAI8YPE3_9PEZI|nr:Uu.00g052430.m01.CDS01 [Anthostomella pinea]